MEPTKTLNFKAFLLACEQNVPGTHLDGNSGWNGASSGAVLDTQQTGSETKGGNNNYDNGGLSLYSTELGLGTRQEPGRIITKVTDRPKIRLDFRDHGYVEVDRRTWFKIAKGKTNIYEIKPGDIADVEYYANRFDKNAGPQRPIAIQIRDGALTGETSPNYRSSLSPKSWKVIQQ